MQSSGQHPIFFFNYPLTGKIVLPYALTSPKQYLINKFIDFMLYLQRTMKNIIEENSSYVPVTQYRELRSLITSDYVGYGNKMGEGWLLTAEMLDLCHMKVNNVVCTQPFG